MQTLVSHFTFYLPFATEIMKLLVIRNMNVVNQDAYLHVISGPTS